MGILCGLCHDASQAKFLSLGTGRKYFVDKVCGKRQQPGRKALAHEKDSRHCQLISTNKRISTYVH